MPDEQTLSQSKSQNLKNFILGNAILTTGGRGQDIGSVTKTKVRQAVDFGQSFAKNVSTTAIRFRSTYSNKSPEYIHSQLSKPRNGVSESSNIALTSAFAAKILKNGK